MATLRLTILVAGSLLALAVNGCASDDPKSGTEPAADAEFASGPYLLTANKVADGCLDGAASIVAIPDGVSREFTNPLTFPGSADGDFKTQLTLVAPFTAVDVTFKKGDGFAWTWDGSAKNAGVDLGELSGGWPGCTADFSFAGEWAAEETTDGKVRFVGKASFIVDSMTGDACPDLVGGEGCSVTLDMIASPQ